jgi:hypothetical protein
MDVSNLERKYDAEKAEREDHINVVTNEARWIVMRKEGVEK